jgi:RNA polymerase sigma factor (sigma-70 family)
MHDARDEEDRRLLEAGHNARLVEGYYGVILRRCQAKVPGQDALDVAANVAVRLLAELKRGRRYRVPFRVVVHNVISWKIKEYYQEAGFTEELLDEQLAGEDPFRGLEDALDFETDLAVLLDGLPQRARGVAELRIRDGRTPDEIAELLGITRNNVDQAWHRAKQALLEKASR